MSANVLLNLLNELGKRDKMRGLPSIWQILWNLISDVKTLWFCHHVRNVVMDVIMFSVILLTTSGLSILLHGVISLPDETSYDKV